MTSTPRRFKPISVSVAVLIFTVLLAGTHAKETTAHNPTALGIEILSLKKVFYIAASDTTKVVIRAYSDTYPGNISAVRIEPRMDGEKLNVTVSALVGEPGDVRTCSDWDTLKTLPLAVVSAGVDEEVTVTKLSEYGIFVGDNSPLTFRVVPKKPAPPVIQGVQMGGDCECGTCGGTTCCANPGRCLGCGSCGYVCCSNSYGAKLRVNGLTNSLIGK